MKTSNILSYIGHHGASVFLLSVAVGIGLSGCSTLQNIGSHAPEGKVVTLADGRKVVVSNANSGSPSSKSLKKPSAPKAAKTPKPAKEKKNKKRALSVSDRKSVDTPDSTLICGDTSHTHLQSSIKVDDTAISTPPSQPAASVSTSTPQNIVATPASPVLTPETQDDFTINGEWTIYSVRGNLVGGEERPYITFDLPVGRFYGNNGCNYINGDITVAPNQAISFGNVIATMKMCQDDQFQYLINLALNDVKSFTVREEKPVTFLDMKDSTGRIILVLRRHNMDFLNGAWKVIELNDTPLAATSADDEATLTFDTADLKIHGTTGCNIFNGSIFIDPDKTNSLQIIGLSTTRKGCPPDSRETEFLLALEEVENARRISSSEILLTSPDGRPLFKMLRMELRDVEQR